MNSPPHSTHLFPLRHPQHAHSPRDSYPHHSCTPHLLVPLPCLGHHLPPATFTTPLSCRQWSALGISPPKDSWLCIAVGWAWRTFSPAKVHSPHALHLSARLLGTYFPPRQDPLCLLVQSMSDILISSLLCRTWYPPPDKNAASHCVGHLFPAFHPSFVSVCPLPLSLRLSSFHWAGVPLQP